MPVDLIGARGGRSEVARAPPRMYDPHVDPVRRHERTGHPVGSPKNNFAVRLAAPPTDLVSVEEVIVHYDTVIVELNPAELVSVES